MPIVIPNDSRLKARQHFTLRSLIRAILDVMQPQITGTIGDPACGNGCFLLVAHKTLTKTNPMLVLQNRPVSGPGTGVGNAFDRWLP